MQDLSLAHRNLSLYFQPGILGTYVPEEQF